MKKYIFMLILQSAFGTLKSQNLLTLRIDCDTLFGAGQAVGYGVCAEGNFSELGISEDPNLYAIPMSQVDSSTIWEITVDFPDSALGRILNFRFVFYLTVVNILNQWEDPPYILNNCFTLIPSGLFRSTAISNIPLRLQYCWESCAQCDGSSPEMVGWNRVYGSVYYDVNGNEIKEVNEPGVSGINLILIENGDSLYRMGSAGDGRYSFFIGSGEKSLSLELPSNFNTELSIQAINFQDSTGSNTELNFPVTLSPDYRDLEIIPILPLMLAGFEATSTLIIRNHGVLAQNIQVNLQLPDYFDNVFSPGAIQDGTNLQWNITQLEPFQEQSLSISFHIPPPPTFMPDDIVTWSGSVEILDGETKISDNSFNLNVPIVASYDPNDKTMMNGKSLSPEQANNGEPFLYRVRFQNTGNYPATFIHVRDTLEAGFDANTFRTLSASHTYSVSIYENRFIDWYFPNIQLPDSTTDPEGSQGYVLFTVNPVLPLSIGDSLSNTAHIYFDFNPAVITNTEITTVVQSAGISSLTENTVRVVNSISSGTIYLQGETSTLKTIRLYSIAGKLVQQWSGYTAGLYAGEVSDGIYLLECISEKGKSVNKLIISN